MPSPRALGFLALGLFACGGASGSARRGADAGSGSDGSGPTGPLPTPVGDPGGPMAPTGLTVTNDDHVARVQWMASPDSRTVGYKMTWGPLGTYLKAVFTPYTDIDIQPLDQGETYQVMVQAVDKDGLLSDPIGPGMAHHDPTYVDNLRATMNGLFDDFNVDSFGHQLDPTHYFVSFDNAGQLSMAFLFYAQDHMHFFLVNPVPYGSGNDDRGSLCVRALRQFDFTGRTGTIVWDFDWGRAVGGRYQWYLSLSPQLVDDVNYDYVLPDGSHGRYLGDALDLTMQLDTVTFEKVQNGQVVQTWWANFDDPSSLRDINVRKHSKLSLSQDSATLIVDGITVLTATGLGLDFTKAWVYNQQFQYNLPKASIPFALSHWDNFGFDAPAGYAPDVVHEYTDGNNVESDRSASLPATFTIQIPDPLAGETAERLFVNASISAGDAPTLTVNGANVAWPVSNGDDNVAPDTRVLDLPLGTLHTGANTVTLADPGRGVRLVGNVHAEVSFPNGSSTPYTPPTFAHANTDPETLIPAVGPAPGFGAVGPASGSTVSGVVPVEVTADAGWTLLPEGHANAITKISLDVDGAPAAFYTLKAPTVATDQIIMLDTTKLANGAHSLTVTAYGMDTNPDGSLAKTSTGDPIFSDYCNDCMRPINVAN